jgi:hypothetical protein
MTDDALMVYQAAIPSLIFLITSVKRFSRLLSTFNGSCQYGQKPPPPEKSS